MKLLEVFDHPYALSKPIVDKDAEGFGHVKYEFTTEGGVVYEVTFSSLADDEAMVEFKPQGGKMQLTGTGDEFRVFSTVISACKAALKLMPEVRVLNMMVVKGSGKDEEANDRVYRKRFDLYRGIIDKVVPKDWTVDYDSPVNALIEIVIKIPGGYVR